MKIKAIEFNEPLAFKPVRIEITFETQKELDAFGSLFSHPFIDGLLIKATGVSFPNYFKPLKAAGADCNRFIDSIDHLLYTPTSARPIPSTSETI